MRILIIAYGFAPSSVIGAVRPTKFAKYLSLFGHDVTVLCSKKCFGAKDEDSMIGLEKIKICRVGDSTETNIGKRAAKRRKNLIYRFLKKIYYSFIWPMSYYRNSYNSYMEMRNYYMDNLKNSSFDIIISTFPDLSNVFLANYLKRKFHFNTVLDLRDNMTDPRYPLSVNLFNRRYQKHSIEESARTFIVSKSATAKLKSENPLYSSRINTLYNGYDDNYGSSMEVSDTSPALRIAYTGAMYSGLRDATPLFHAIRKLIDECGYEFQIDYAGQDIEILKEQASKFELANIVSDYGIVNMKEAEQIQKNADLFLVLTWNTKKEQGVLSGKFYEGIKCNKPILAIVKGELINSELYKLNEEYHYGYCYEVERNNSEEGLYDYLRICCQEKQKYGCLKRNQSSELAKKFHYRNLTKELERQLYEIMKEKRP
ncbi:MAG: glycosyltransferase family 4 protein [Hungatella sp.]|nr:glycosyltransferase family 4 protein [Hungatella sp.]